MIQREVLVGLVQQVFKIFILTFFISCVSYQSDTIWLDKTIDLEENRLESIKRVQSEKLETQQIENRVVTKGSISTLSLIDEDLWIGKLGGELLRYNIYTQDTIKILDNNYSIIDYSIKAVVSEGSYVYILQSNRIIRFNKLLQNYLIFDFPENITRASSMVIGNNRLYIGTLGSGIWEYSLKDGSYRYISDELKYVSSLLLKDNELFIGSMDNGIYIYDLQDDRYKSRLFFPFALFRKNILCMSLKKDQLWIGTAENGLIIWSLESNKVIRNFEDETISSITHNRELSAISIMDEGVVLFNNGKKYLLSIDNGLLTHNITALILYDNRLFSGNIRVGVIDRELLQF